MTAHIVLRDFSHALHQVAQAQVTLDDNVRNLIDEMDKSCKIAEEAAPLKKRSSRFNEILEKVLQQVTECAYFVLNYSGEKSFGACLGSCRNSLPFICDVLFRCPSLEELVLRC